MTLLEQHLQLQARLKVSTSAVSHYRNKLLEYRATADQLAPCQAQLQETQAKYDKLAAQVSEEDQLFFDYANDYKHVYSPLADEIRRLRPYLWQEPPDDT